MYEYYSEYTNTVETYLRRAGATTEVVRAYEMYYIPYSTE